MVVVVVVWAGQLLSYCVSPLNPPPTRTSLTVGCTEGQLTVGTDPVKNSLTARTTAEVTVPVGGAWTKVVSSQPIDLVQAPRLLLLLATLLSRAGSGATPVRGPRNHSFGVERSPPRTKRLVLVGCLAPHQGVMPGAHCQTQVTLVSPQIFQTR